LSCLLEGVGDRFVICKDVEVARFQHVAKMLYGLVYGQQLAVVCTVFLLSLVKFFWKRRRGAARRYMTRCCSTAPMPDAEASMTLARGADGSSAQVVCRVTKSPCIFRRTRGPPLST
jgi:hypothetical protein